ncbi:hypothetical protein [Sneathiella glossodoripedis]|uniref:hypothetical protein n=1 Tax=Sneathiella glossodoripedis TaxID=418853 RepID=UPI0009FF11F2|nr:hypothetical protein [Sneathiella glossodoripedis]
MNNGSYNREVFHGGDLDHAMSVYGSGGPTWIDLSTGINPHPYPIPELSTEAWVRLPSASLEKRLHDAARLYYGISSETPLVAASGTQASFSYFPC